MMSFMEMSMGMGFMAGGVSFILNYGHLLSSLLSLEYMVVMIYWWVSVACKEETSFLLFYLVMAVCEGVLGLSLLIGSVLSQGSDQMSFYSCVAC
uniref:NADH dehydrogenase subunit 4L n=1 Tax=Gammarus nipponensis TaxID=353628 RepID=UPI00286D5B50|nr:NADH dehydrogenase subunit 4L [Gammarus nipponensis]WLS55465.1 NADH dehydrogenase subunit 4L [Gammarus nipponensis]